MYNETLIISIESQQFTATLQVQIQWGKIQINTD